ncbi:MAG: hypothetical protein WCO78_01240 [Candidatus Roizmanbacteria bacterium]
MIKPNLYTSPTPTVSTTPAQPGAPRPLTPKKKISTATQAIPFVDDAHDKKQFMKTMVISFSVFTVISAILVGMALYSKWTQGSTQATTTRVVRQDDTGLRVVSASEPTQVPAVTPIVPTTVPTPGAAGYSVPVITGSSFTVPVISGSRISSSPTTNPLSPTLTLTPTIYVTSIPGSTATPTPTSVLYMSTESTYNQIDFGNVPVGTEITSEVTMRNIGTSPITINSMFFSTVGATNPFIIQTGSASTLCLTNSDLPYNLGSNESRCILFKYTPSGSSINSNMFLLYWNTGFVKSITLNGTVTTPTPTPTITPTGTPSPTPAGKFYLSSDATSGEINFGSILLGSNSIAQITLHNVDNVPITISNAYLASTGTVNPFSLEAGTDSCLITSPTSFPYTLAAYSTTCLRFKFEPGQYTVNTNYFLMYWSTRLLKSIKLTGVLITPTPTLTMTPSPTP